VSGRDTDAVKRVCSQTAAQVTDLHPSAQSPRAGDPGLRGSQPTMRKARFSTPALGCRSMPRSASHRESDTAALALQSGNERGAAVVMALLMAVLVGAIAAALVTLTTTETLISASFRQAYEASYAAEAALERGLHDLATMPDWSLTLTAPPANLTSSFSDGESRPIVPDGRALDLARLTSDRQRESDERDGPSVFGSDSPQWRLFGHDSPRALLPGPGLDLPLYLVVWVADDESDGDGNPEVDSNGRILVAAVALGAGGARQSIEARIARADLGQIRVLAWRKTR
jgi:hypothetical protein